MKKSLIALLVLACVAPAMAVVDFGLVNNGDGTATITINTNGDVVRGVGLLVTCTDGAKLADLAPVAVNAAFNTYIDYAFDNSGYDFGQGHPFADASAAGVAAVDDTTFSVSLGVLDNNGGQAGFNGSDNLITINTGAGHVCIELDTLRGGVVGDVALTATMPACVDVTAGPACWNYAMFGNGDSNGDGAITFTDLNAIINAWAPNPYNACADFNKDGAITFTDLNVIINNWPQ